MKVNIGPYKDYFGPYQLVKPLEVLFGEDFANKIAEKLPHVPFEKLDKLRQRKIDVHIDDYDTWSVNHTLALIIVPLLKSMKGKKQGIPVEFVNDKDKEYGGCGYPEQLELFDDLDEFYKGESERQWNNTLDHMIWAFEQILDDQVLDERDDFYIPMTPEEIAEREARYEEADLSPFKFNDNMKLDIFAYQEYNDQIQEGLDLFAKHFRSLWT